MLKNVYSEFWRAKTLAVVSLKPYRHLSHCGGTVAEIGGKSVRKKGLSKSSLH